MQMFEKKKKKQRDSNLFVFFFVCLPALQHTTRTFHNLQGQVESQDSGLWINSFDYTGIQHITPIIPEVNDSIRTHCQEDRPFCGYPWFLPVKFLSKSEAQRSLFDIYVVLTSWRVIVTLSVVLCLQEELVPSCSRSVSQPSCGIQPGVQRGDEVGDDQDDLQC